ncbi:MAG: hypothetical protein ABWX92_17105 [Mycetocola sp.]
MTASNVTFVGPVIIAPMGNTDLGVSVFDSGGGGPEAIFWEIAPHRSQVSGAIGVIDCTFVACNFIAVGYAATAEHLDRMRAHMLVE